MRPSSPILRAFDRVRIRELLEATTVRLGRKADRAGIAQTRKDLAAVLFPDNELGRQREGSQAPLSWDRKSALISQWNSGEQLTSMKPRHVLRMGEFFGTTNIHELFEFQPDKPL